MSNIVYNYPKSSCSCYGCGNKLHECNSGGIPSNMSIRDCKIPSIFECHDRKQFRYDIEPKNNHGYVNLNPDVVQEKYASDFKRMNCSGDQNCPKIQYASQDPRLISVAHGGQVLTLDRPPLETEPKLDTISSDIKLDCYGKGYRTYSDINAGQIMYYIDKSRQDPFYLPNFPTSARAYGTLYRDPMGSFKPQYDRDPLKCDNPLNTTRDNYDGGLSWIQDSQEHRQDLLSRMMRKQNEQRWEPRWTD